MESSPKANRLAAASWLTLAVAMAGLGIYVLFTPGKYLMPSFLGLSLVLVYVGRERLARYKLGPTEFQTRVRSLGLFVALAAAVGGTVGLGV